MVLIIRQSWNLKVIKNPLLYWYHQKKKKRKVTNKANERYQNREYGFDLIKNLPELEKQRLVDYRKIYKAKKNALLWVESVILVNVRKYFVFCADVKDFILF